MLTATLALAACSDDEGVTPTTTTGSTTTTQPEVGTIEDRPDCGEGLCPVEFLLDGVPYALDCGAVRADAVDTVVLARGVALRQDLAAHGIRGVDRAVAVAVDRPGGICDGDEVTPTSEWSFAFGDGADPGAITAAVCAAGEAAERAASGC